MESSPRAVSRRSSLFLLLLVLPVLWFGPPPTAARALLAPGEVSARGIESPAAGAPERWEWFDCPYSGPRSEEVLSFHVEEYLLDVSLDFASKTIGGTVTAQCRSLGELREARFDFYQGTVFEVLLNGDPVSATYDGVEVVVPLDPPLGEGDPFTVAITYSASGREHFTWKPAGNPTTAYNPMVETSRWAPCLHDPRDKASRLELRVTVPEDKYAACNGVLQARVPADDRTVTWIWVESDPIASYLFTINVSAYEVRHREYQGMDVVYYIFPEDWPAAEVDFQHDMEILAFFESAFGPYPFEKLGLAETMIGGAMENQDMISYGRVLISGDLQYEDTFAHEISHMYWGDGVTLTECADTWLNEGFASYCEALWEEHFYGAAAAEAVMAAFKESYLEDDPNNRLPVGDPDWVWTSTVYHKGAWVVHMLRQVIGDEAFWRLMPAYFAAHRYGSVTTADFQAAAEAEYGASLDWFFQEWVYDIWHPELGFGWTPDPADPGYGVIVAVDQTQSLGPIFRVPLELDVITSEGASTRTLWIEQASHRFRVSSSLPVFEVLLDPRGRLLHTRAAFTFTPTPGPTASSTPTPPAATATSVPTASPSPTPTCGALGVRLRLAREEVHPGESFWVAADVCAPDAPLEDTPFVAMLDIGTGDYWFYPSWSHYPPAIDYESRDFPRGASSVEILPAFTWPDTGENAMSPIYFHAALLSQDLSAILGEMDSRAFGFGPAP
jgi:hypothetical protein